MSNKQAASIDNKDMGVEYRDTGPWRNYELTATGATQEEMEEGATISEVDQDGGELRTYGLEDAPSDVHDRAIAMIAEAVGHTAHVARCAAADPAKVFGLSAHQVAHDRRAQTTGQPTHAAPSAPAHNGSDVTHEVTQLFQSTYDAEGPDGLINLCYSTHDEATQSAMKQMLIDDADGAIVAMVSSLTASPEACAAWEAFTSELVAGAPESNPPGTETAPAEGPAVAEASPELGNEHQAAACPGCGAAIPPGATECACGHKEAEEEPAEQEPAEPEFKAGEAIEPVNEYGMGGKPAMITGIKHGYYLTGFNQAKLGTFGHVEANYRRLGERLTPKQAHATADNSRRVSRVVKAAYSLRWREFADESPASESIIKEQDFPSIEERYSFLEGLKKDPKFVDVLDMDGQKVGKIAGDAGPDTECKIQDWAGNTMFNGETFHTFDDAEEFLSEKLGDSYEEDRQEYYIVSLEKSARQAQVTLPEDYVAKYVKITETSEGFHVEVESPISGDIVMQGNASSHEQALAEGKAVLAEYPEPMEASQHQAGIKIAVDESTRSYFVAYFKEYGAQLTRPLAFRKSAKIAQAKRLECTVCGALFDTDAEANDHVTKSHQDRGDFIEVEARKTAQATSSAAGGFIWEAFEDEGIAEHSGMYKGRHFLVIGAGHGPMEMFEGDKSLGTATNLQHAERQLMALVDGTKIASWKPRVAQQLKWFRFKLDNGNTISVEAVDEQEARTRAEANLETSKIVESLGEAKTAQYADLSQTQGWANDAYGEWTRALLEENKANANKAYEEIRGFMERYNIEPQAFSDNPQARKQFFQYDPQTGMLSKTSSLAKSMRRAWKVRRAEHVARCAQAEQRFKTVRKLETGETIETETSVDMRDVVGKELGGGWLGPVYTLVSCEPIEPDPTPGKQAALDSYTKAGVDQNLNELLDANPGMTLAQAAAQHLATKEGWYKQTPEGQYLMDLASGKSGHQAQLKEKDIKYENGDFWVADEGDSYTVYESGITHSTSDSAYAHDDDGFSIAKARCDYLARRKNGHQAGYGDAPGKFEAAEKDIKRMEGMRDKAAGDDQKVLQLAYNMARSIDKEDKASRRADAAEKVFGGSLGTQVAAIFETRAKELE